MSPGWIETHREWPDASDIPRDLPDGEPAVRFTLSYDGPLPSCSQHQKRCPEKQALRREFNYQLVQVWKTEPVLSSLLKNYPQFEEARLNKKMNRLYRPDNPKKPATYGVRFGLEGFWFVPLITAQNNLWCELDVVLYRNGDPGHILSKHGVDLDSNLKLIFDGLRMPQTKEELAGDRPESSDPFFCVLEDDRLITRLTIDTKRRILRTDEKKRKPSDVLVTVGVNVLARKLTDINRGLLV